MNVSPAGAALVKEFEGCALEAYRDIAGVWTIGYGWTGPVNGRALGPGTKIAQEEADALLLAALAQCETDLNAWMKDHAIALNRNEFDALVSFIYNEGFSHFRYSTIALKITARDHPGAGRAFALWNRATIGGRLQPVDGLTKRRAAEAALFRQPAKESS